MQPRRGSLLYVMKERVVAPAPPAVVRGVPLGIKQEIRPAPFISAVLQKMKERVGPMRRDIRIGPKIPAHVE